MNTWLNHFYHLSIFWMPDRRRGREREREREQDAGWNDINQLWLIGPWRFNHRVGAGVGGSADGRRARIGRRETGQGRAFDDESIRLIVMFIPNLIQELCWRNSGLCRVVWRFRWPCSMASISAVKVVKVWVSRVRPLYRHVGLINGRIDDRIESIQHSDTRTLLKPFPAASWWPRWWDRGVVSVHSGPYQLEALIEARAHASLGWPRRAAPRHRRRRASIDAIN